MRYRLSLLVLGIAMAMALGVSARGALAQTYPSRPVRIIVGFAPGGPVDNLARLLARKLSDATRQQFIVDNKPGASGMIGAQAAARAEPDGYTLVMVAATHAVNPSVHRRMAYDTENDFAPISLLSEGAFVLVVPSRLPVASVPDLVAYARREHVNYASAGIAGLPHLVTEMFRTVAGIDGNHIPYRGAAPATMDVMAGRADFMFNNIVSAMPGIRDGQLRALAVTTRDRDPALPEVPSLYELGYTSIDISGWYGLLAPAGTSPAIVARLNAELSRILGDADVIRSLRTEGMRPMGSTPQDFRLRIRQDATGWAAVVRAAGITAD